MENPTNQDLLERIDALENKVDHICNMIEQANGAWTLVKIIASISFGLAAMWSYLHDWFGWHR